MNKFKILPLAATLLLAATFTASCTDGEDDNDQSLPSIRSEVSPSDAKYGGSDALPTGVDDKPGYIDPLVDPMPDPMPPPYKEPVYIEPDNGNPPVPDTTDGSLDGAWQKGPALLKISGRFAHLETGNEAAYGAIGYNKQGGSFQPTNQGSELVIGFRYTLNGKVLTFSDVTGDIFDALSGEWTEFVGTPGTPSPTPDDKKR